MAIKPHFDIDTEAIGRLILKSQQTKELGEQIAAEKLGPVEQSYTGTQRVWIEGKHE